MFINNRFNEAIACAGMKIREEHYDYIETIFDEITPYGWECHCEDARKLEDENTGLEEKLADPSIASDVGKLMELHKQKTANDERIESLLERWEELSLNV